MVFSKNQCERMQFGLTQEELVSQSTFDLETQLVFSKHWICIGRVEEHVADAVARGAKVATGGRRHALGGNFFEPTVLTEVPRAAQIFSDETFGPVAPLFRFETEEEALSMANDTPFGLAAYFYARDVGRIFRVSSALEFGIIGVNEGFISTEVAPFGGVKASGLGREGSKYGVEDYLEIKYIALGGL